VTRDWRTESVLVATPHRADIAAAYSYSLLAMFAHDVENHRVIVRGGGPMPFPAGPMNLTDVRNKFCKVALDTVDADWLLFIDADAGFGPDLADRLLEAADPVDRPIVGALAFMVTKRDADDMGGWHWTPAPTMYKWGNDKGEPGFYVMYDYPDNTLVRVAATGCHALLIHRGVLEKLRAEHGDRWFDRVMLDPEQGVLGEDFSFCARAGRAGVSIFVHTGVKTSHQQTVWLCEENYQAMLLASRLTDVARQETAPGPPVFVDITASLATLTDPGWGRSGMLKLDTDLDRYAQIIAATRPEVIVETGTRTGASARWFADRGLEVITIDSVAAELETAAGVQYVRGDSADPETVAFVAGLVAGRRCMVSLDSDHSAAHVAREIGLYGPLVTAGCYLVVEDTIFAHAPQALRDRHFPGGLDGSPLEAVEQLLAGDPGWSRDVAIERAHPTSHHPAGWWIRNG
jgi:cephalosporin hydroxylase